MHHWEGNCTSTRSNPVKTNPFVPATHQRSVSVGRSGATAPDLQISRRQERTYQGHEATSLRRLVHGLLPPPTRTAYQFARHAQAHHRPEAWFLPPKTASKVFRINSRRTCSRRRRPRSPRHRARLRFAPAPSHRREREGQSTNVDELHNKIARWLDWQTC